jgi:hypothetical protein
MTILLKLAASFALLLMVAFIVLLFGFWPRKRGR